MGETKPIFGCDFEVFGKVQGVQFRQHAQRYAKALGVYGSCCFSSEGTVKGHLEAPLSEINEMKFWLQNHGSPKSLISHAMFTPTKEIPVYTTKIFTIRE